MQTNLHCAMRWHLGFCIMQSGQASLLSGRGSRPDGMPLALTASEVQLALQVMPMMDAVFVLATLAFFTAAWAYAHGCAQL